MGRALSIKFVIHEKLFFLQGKQILNSEKWVFSIHRFKQIAASMEYFSMLAGRKAESTTDVFHYFVSLFAASA